MADRRIVTDYPEPIAAAYQKGVLAEHDRELHDDLLELGHATLEHIWLILRSEYVARREARGADADVEQTLQRLSDQATRSWGHTLAGISALWRGSRDESLLKIGPQPRKERQAVHEFVTSWSAIKGIWGDHKGAPVNVPYGDLVPKRRKDDKGATSLHRFFGDLINSRNAFSHRDAFPLSDDAEPVRLELGDTYFAFITPLLRRSLDEMLEEFREFLVATPVSQVASIQGKPDGRFVVRFKVLTGVGAAQARDWPTDEPKKFKVGTRWILGGSSAPLLRLTDEYFPAFKPPPAAAAPAPPESPPPAAGAKAVAADSAPTLSSASDRLARAELAPKGTAVRLEDLTSGARVLGIIPGGPLKIEIARWVGSDCVEVIVEDGDGRVGKHLVFRDREPELCLAASGRPWSFDGDPELFRLAAEAHRIRLAWHFDPFLAVSTSAILPLPHQISAVYETMLERQPLRFLLADDPGAGKTIMAGLLIKELVARGDLKRCLIVAPGSLVEQWQDELGQKFGLDFDLLTRDLVNASRSGNPFENHHLLVSRLDQLSRDDELQEKLQAAPEWDLVICDEAHRMSGHYIGGEVKLTKRYRLGERLGRRCRNLLLMTATPHNGKDEDFQLFMGLLDGDRFAGRFRDGVHTVDVTDMMRRMVKEDLYRFDGTPLFPERRSYTIKYPLSTLETQLYAEVTEYVSNEMDRVERMDDARRVVVGFALMTLQRRLASSPLAIYRSLQRRRERLEERLGEERLLLKGRKAAQDLGGLKDDDDIDELLEDAPQDEREEVEQKVVDLATAAQTVEELAIEIKRLKELAELAKKVVQSGTDKKWSELNTILDDPLMVDTVTGARRKLIVFTEFRDTLQYVADRIRVRLGRDDAVVMIHGGVKREERRKIIEAFQNDPKVHVLVANDAAGEGVNLQRAHLMVNYDLPWNPNRLEQRFGRIHRIGQREVCHLWNLVAEDTREGVVFQRLLEKLDAEREALGGKVFDVVGKLFDARALRELLMEAIQYGNDPAVRARIDQKVSDAVDHVRIEKLLDERRLSQVPLDSGKISEIREAMERAHARRLQPHFVQSFFIEAFRRVGGTIHPREEGRFEITRVPVDVQQRDRVIGVGTAIPRAYERVCFDTAKVSGPPAAALVCPGMPLLDAVVDLTLERHGDLLRQGTVLVDDRDLGTTPRLLVTIEHKVQDGVRTARGDLRLVSERLFFVECGPDGVLRSAGVAPYLDYRPTTPAERDALKAELDAAWLSRDWDGAVIDFAIRELAGKHTEEVQRRRKAHVDKVHVEVNKRLKREINYWDRRAAELRRQEQAGKQTGLPADNARDRAQILTDRLQARLKELECERRITAQPPRIVGGALVLPAGLLRSRGIVKAPAAGNAEELDPVAKDEVERLAMEAVLAAERALGRVPRDVSDQRGLGYDIESKEPKDGSLIFLEVKGRSVGAGDVTITRSEILCALNEPKKFRLALVLVEDGKARSPVYVREPDFGQPGFGLTSASYSLGPLLERGRPPE